MESLPQEFPAKAGRSRTRVRIDCKGSDEAEHFEAGDAANDSRMLQLARAIEQEIIPRLMLAHRAHSDRMAPVGVGPGRPEIDAADVSQFAKLVLAQDEDLALAAVDAFRQRGVPVESVYLDLLAPTARRLGELWDEDLCSFTDVTVGLGRLQRVLRELSPSFGCTVEHPDRGRRVVLLPSPGEQHTFGLVMVAEFFRRAGWDVSGVDWGAGVDAAALVGSEWFDVIGFSLGAERHLDALQHTISAVRQASCNRGIAVLVGGPMFGAFPHYVERVGADGMTSDGAQAPALAERLITKVAGV